MCDLKTWLHEKQLEFDEVNDITNPAPDNVKEFIRGVKYGLYLAEREVKRREESGEI